MATAILLRHGRSTANAEGILAGRLPGIPLDETGRGQAAEVAGRLAALPIRAVISSPLERCLQTARAVAKAQVGQCPVRREQRLVECGYGEWTGRQLHGLARERLWKVVQSYPSGVAFPDGESMRQMAARATDAVRDWDARISAEYGEDAIWVAVTHGDIVKAVLADALGAHLDVFQRIVVEPASVSVVRYAPGRPFVLRLNEHGDLAGLRPHAARRRRSVSGDAVVGGETGT
ncbi:MAG: MSMEG_4193 family putative phosphomutase [Sciscionella sp.]